MLRYVLGRHSWVPTLSLLICTGFLTGCGGGSGPPSYVVSGKVTFNGQPLPYGIIEFIPTNNTDARPTTATVTNGSYTTNDTGINPNAGPHKVRIRGYDSVPAAGNDSEFNSAPSPKVLFTDYTVDVTLPAASSTQDIDVPESAKIK